MTIHLLNSTNSVRQEGLEEEMQQGMQQGEASLLLRMIEQKFGSQPEIRREQIRNADVETLDKWSELLFEAKTVEDILH